MSADGFRGRVSQVRILPGPLLCFNLFTRLKSLSFVVIRHSIP